MSPSATVTAEQVKKTLAWVRASFIAAEADDISGWFTDFFYPDGAITFNDQPPTKGYEAMKAYFDQFNSVISSTKHVVERVDVLSDRIYIQVHVEFVVKNDPEQKKVVVGGMVAAQKKIDEEKVSFYKIYTDKAPLEERIKMFNWRKTDFMFSLIRK